MTVKRSNLETELNKGYRAEVKREELKHFNEDEISQALRLISSHRDYQVTPLRSLDALAKRLNLSGLYVKDESYRFGLKAFKIMGGLYAVMRCLAEKLQMDLSELSIEMLKTDRIRQRLGSLTFISATDGNHGRGVARVAAELGYPSIIRMPKGSSVKRLAAIRAEGADAEITDVNYDETVRLCKTMAREKGYVMIQDTSWPGYEKIPLWIMQGYAAIAKEIAEQMGGEVPTHIFLQAGVGSFACGIAGYFLRRFPLSSPKIIIVEPDRAACFFQSFSRSDGEIEPVNGDMSTIMAGLACGEPNKMAYDVLHHYSFSAISVSDDATALGMRIYGNPLHGDPTIISGESGAVTMGALYRLCTETARQKDLDRLAIDETSKVLLINTEGDTDSESYRDIVWKGRFPNFIQHPEEAKTC